MGIAVRALTRQFKNKFVFSAERLEFRGPGLVVLRGPNGSGKTTFLRVLSTLIAPTGGDAWVNGASVVTDPARVREAIGFVPATDGGFFKRLTGEENLVLFGGLRGLDAAETQQSLGLWSEVLPLAEALRVPFAHASAGMRQSLAIARALLHDPQVVLLDEPTRSLDPETSAQVRASLKVLAAKKVVLFSSHRPEEWLGANAVWEIRDGDFTERRSPAHATADLAEPVASGQA